MHPTTLRRSAIALAVTWTLLLTGCTIMGGQDSSCSATELSPSLREKYSLPDLPEAEEIRFCEGSDRDGFWAQLTFRSDPENSLSYLKSLDLHPERFAPVPTWKVEELSHQSGEGWRLSKGSKYKTGSKAREGNGHCLVDYQAYLQDTADWDGRIYMGMYCET